MAAGSNQTTTGRYVMPDVNAWSAERWAAVIVLLALGFLVLIRMGFRGVDVLGARVSVGN
jgi:hypothetical protein